MNPAIRLKTSSIGDPSLGLGRACPYIRALKYWHSGRFQLKASSLGDPGTWLRTQLPTHSRAKTLDIGA